MMNFDDNKPYPDDVALLKLLGRPGMISFAGGIPDPEHVAAGSHDQR